MNSKPGDTATLTTSAGSPVPDNQNSITAGHGGPLLMQGCQIIKKLAHHWMPLTRTVSLIGTRTPNWTQSLDPNG